MGLAVTAVAYRDGALLNFGLVGNCATVALAFDFHLNSPAGRGAPQCLFSADSSASWKAPGSYCAGEQFAAPHRLRASYAVQGMLGPVAVGFHPLVKIERIGGSQVSIPAYSRFLNTQFLFTAPNPQSAYTRVAPFRFSLSTPSPDSVIPASACARKLRAISARARPRRRQRSRTLMNSVQPRFSWLPAFHVSSM